MFRGKIHHIHFVGIGGSGMSGIAEVLLTMGFSVTGSDLSEGSAVVRLRGLGATVHLGHDPAHVDGVDVVVKSTAIPDRNVEIQAALGAKIPVIPRAEMLGELMRMKYGVAVAGTHGKTTTTSMLARVLQAAELDPTVVIGGRLDAMGSSARLGAGDFMVAEADESDGSFLLLDPTITVVTNIDPEHLDHWGTVDALHEGFVEFAGSVPFFGFATLCLDHPVVQTLIPRLRRPVATYGFSAQADVRGHEFQSSGLLTTLSVSWAGTHLGELRLGMPGRHNALNALAATTVALELGVPFARIQEGLEGFSGVDRRFSVRAEGVPTAGSLEDISTNEAVTIIDDYAHHPTEIIATLGAAAEAWPNRRIVAVFQPHRFTRVRDLADDFARSFNDATHVVVCPIYRAGERPIEGVDHRSLAASLAHHGHRSVEAAEDLEGAVNHLLDHARPGDVIITLGAGDVNRVCGELAHALGLDGESSGS